MTQVDFYFNATNLHSVAQRLIAKALAAKQKLVVCGEAETLATFDTYLWTFDATSFVPHVYAGDALATVTPVLLSTDGDNIPNSHDGLLINIGQSVPACFSRYQRVLELVGADEPSKIAARERFKHYKSRGYPMKSVDLTKK